MLSDCTVRPLLIIPPPSPFDHNSGLQQAVEKLGGKAFLAQRAIEAYAAAVLPGLNRFSMYCQDPLVFEKSGQDFRAKLRAIITLDISWSPIASDQLLESVDALTMGKRSGHIDHQTEFRGLIFDSPTSDFLSVREKRRSKP
jgi:hypothetical protein